MKYQKYVGLLAFIVICKLGLKAQDIEKEADFVERRCYCIYPGSKDDMKKFLSTMLLDDSKQYQREEKIDLKEGIAICNINKNGEIFNPSIWQSADTLVDKSIIRAINQMPKWVPNKNSCSPEITTVIIPYYVGNPPMVIDYNESKLQIELSKLLGKYAEKDIASGKVYWSYPLVIKIYDKYVRTK